MALIAYPKMLSWSDFFPWQQTQAWMTPAMLAASAMTSAEIVPPAVHKPIPDGKKYRLDAFDIEIKLSRGATDTWVMASKQTPTLLDHEQGHLDIAGLVGEEMRVSLEAIREANPAALIASANLTVKKIGARHPLLNSQYETGSQNGTNFAVQTQWDIRFKISKATLGTKQFKPL